jgi:lipoyl-dependent peroxiredoxin
MMVRSATAKWEGNLPQGKGSIATASGSLNGNYSFSSRFESGTGTNPEELIAAAHAGCFSMALSHILAEAGHTARSVETTANVKLEKVEGGFAITSIALSTVGNVPGIDEAMFMKLANDAKGGCPVSKALASVPITLDAKLVAATAS